MAEENEEWTELTETSFDKWDKEFKKEHPIQNWIDETFFRERGIGGYRGSYALTHPWKIAEYMYYECKYALQRIFKNWDDTVIWSIDYYLDKYLPVWLEELIKNKQGCPMMMFQDGDFEEDGHTIKDGVLEVRQKEYFVILQKIADGFRIHRKIGDLDFGYDTPEEKEAQKQFDEAFELFHKFYETFWD
jgi:hypothetical protein